MPNSTRLLLQDLQQTLQGEPLKRLPDDPVLAQMAHFRHALRRDVGVLANDERVGTSRCNGYRSLRKGGWRLS